MTDSVSGGLHRDRQCGRQLLIDRNWCGEKQSMFGNSQDTTLRDINSNVKAV